MAWSFWGKLSEEGADEDNHGKELNVKINRSGSLQRRWTRTVH